MIALQEFRELEEHLDSEFGKVDIRDDDDQGTMHMFCQRVQCFACV